MVLLINSVTRQQFSRLHFADLGIEVSQAQFGTNQLFVTIHLRFRFRTLMIAGLIFPFGQFTDFECFNRFVSCMPFFLP